jgi:hypothetical protein
MGHPISCHNFLPPTVYLFHFSIFWGCFASSALGVEFYGVSVEYYRVIMMSRKGRKIAVLGVIYVYNPI